MDMEAAYNAGKLADSEAIAGNFANAGKLYTECAVLFEEAAQQAVGNPGKMMIDTLARQARSSAEYFSSGKAMKDKSMDLPKSPTHKRRHTSSSKYGLAASTADLSSSVMALPLGEAITALTLRSSTVFARTFEQSIVNQSGPFMSGTPAESFYMVRPKPGDERSDIAPDTTMLARARALEQATAAQRTILRNGLQQIKNEIALQEQKIQNEYLDEIDRLRAENDSLRIQLSEKKRKEWLDYDH